MKRKIISIAKFPLLLGILLRLTACAGISSPSPDSPSGALSSRGEEPSSPTPANSAAPTQNSGIPSPMADPLPPDVVSYNLRWGPDAEGLSDGVIYLKGMLEKSDPDSPNLEGRILRVIDRRSRVFREIVLHSEEENESEMPFRINLDVSPVFLSDLYAGRNLLFFVSPFTSSQKNVEAVRLQECPDFACVGSDWYRAAPSGTPHRAP
ncbi:MAG: hypothetical protein U1F57_09690 [bacterium]